jgi:branched-chain amino acid aminotransferase
MNIFFVVNGEIHTPALDGGFLPGITRDSIIQLAKKMGYSVNERPISIHEIVAAAENGSLTESFGTGTAAVVTFINRIGFRGKDYHLSSANFKIAPSLKKGLTDIQKGIADDPFGWVYRVC